MLRFLPAVLLVCWNTAAHAAVRETHVPMRGVVVADSALAQDEEEDVIVDTLPDLVESDVANYSLQLVSLSPPALMQPARREAPAQPTVEVVVANTGDAPSAQSRLSLSVIPDRRQPHVESAAGDIIVPPIPAGGRVTLKVPVKSSSPTACYRATITPL